MYIMNCLVKYTAKKRMRVSYVCYYIYMYSNRFEPPAHIPLWSSSGYCRIIASCNCSLTSTYCVDVHKFINLKVFFTNIVKRKYVAS